MKKIASKEGNLFLIPLRTSGYGLGLIVRKNKSVMLGYFWDIKFPDIPSSVDISSLKEENTLWRTQFGSRGLDKGVWQIIGNHPDFNREDWQVPAFLRETGPFGKYLVFYNNQLKETSMVKITDDILNELSEEEINRVPKDGLAGYGFVELRLTRLLDEPRVET